MRRILNQQIWKWKRGQSRPRQSGTSMVEFLVVLPAMMFTGLGVMQFGLIYHAKSVLNYATFEAARAGAVGNGQIEVMRDELAYRMAPIYGGDGSLEKGAMALTRAKVATEDITTTKIEIINPTVDAFSMHGQAQKTVTDRHGNARDVVAIPNSHLRFAPGGTGNETLSVQDANLLKIKVTYGYQMRLPFLDMKVPGVTWIMRNYMINSNQDNWMYYIRGMIPITSTATVRMQSEAWDTQEPPVAQRAFDAAYAWAVDQINGDNPDGGGECEAASEPLFTPIDPVTGLDGPQSTISLIGDGGGETEMCLFEPPDGSGSGGTGGGNCNGETQS